MASPVQTPVLAHRRVVRNGLVGLREGRRVAQRQCRAPGTQEALRQCTRAIGT
jgi:hypothetical protein